MFKKFLKSKAVTKVIISVSVLAIVSCTAFAASVIPNLTNSGNAKVTAKINTNKVIQSDFLGVGTNLWTDPSDEIEKNIFQMNEAYMQINYKRNMTSKPAYVRYMVLPHWMCFTDDPDAGESKWKAGIYNWESKEMKSFYEYLKEFKKSGTEILLNFGGFTGTKIADWFGIKDSSSPYSIDAAPDDLEAWAKASCALIKKCDEIAPGVVTYYSYYNEISGGQNSNFSVISNKGVYVASMLKLLNKELKAAGIRDKIKICALDLTMQGQDKIDLNEQFCDTVEEYAPKAEGNYDVFVHHYYYQPDYADTAPMKDIDTVTKLNKYVVNKYPNLMVNEFHGSYEQYGTGSFRCSETGLILNCVNNGVSAMANWFYYGVKVPSPGDIYINGTDYLMWMCPSTPKGTGYYLTPSLESAGVTRGIDAVSNVFGERALLMNYIPNHSEVLSSVTENDGVRIATFRKGEDMTVVVELDDADKMRDISVDFGKNIGKKFNKFEYVYDNADKTGRKCTLYDANAIVNTSKGTINVTNVLNDTVGKEHRVMVYTTLSEIKQVELDEVQVDSLKIGETHQFKVTNIYGTNNVRNGSSDTSIFNDKVTWSVAVGGGTIDSDGTYHADGNVKAGDTIAVKAMLNDSVYAIGIVKITE